jgi:hypothetical protein
MLLGQKLIRKFTKNGESSEKVNFFWDYIALHLAVLAALFVNYNPTYIQKVSFWEYP